MQCQSNAVFFYILSREAIKDLSLILSLGKKLKVDCAAQINPYRSQRPIRDFVAEDGIEVFYNNNFYSVVRLEETKKSHDQNRTPK